MPNTRGGLSSEVTDARRSELGLQWREIVAEDAATAARHPLATEVIEESLLQDANDAQAEAYRQLALRSKRRDVFELAVQLNADTETIDLGDTVNINHARFGLTPVTGDDLGEGHPFLVIGVAPDAAKREVTLTVWGTAGAVRNVVADDGDFIVTDTGAYIITAAG